MNDVIHDSIIVLPIIIVFELLMIISWRIHFADHISPGAIGYLWGYISLLVVTSIILAFTFFAKKDFAHKYKQINKVQHFYALAFVCWATIFTYIGVAYRGTFDYLIYITIITIVPLFTYLKSEFWISLHAVSSLFIIYMASFLPHFVSFFINFAVFSSISIVAGYTIHRIRRVAYERQILMEEERNKANELAHKDNLTGIGNRQSFTEEIDALANKPIADDLVIMMLDINGLKTVNDTFGHQAGDELICGTTACMQLAFYSFGNIYRIGGDEFIAILHCSDERAKNAIAQFEQLTDNWEGKLVKELHVAVGFASHSSSPTSSINDLMKKADQAMYKDKTNFYQNNTK